MDRPRALVTGASSGIGEAYARRLAGDGYDLIVVARRRDRLEALAAELPTEVEVLAADLTDRDDLAHVEARIADSPLALLVNNAGYGGYKPFVDLEPDEAERLLAIHALAPMRMTRAALPSMIARGEGAIVTVASTLAFSGPNPFAMLPQRVVYASAKAFQVAFSQLLAHEVAGTGVKVQVCCPGMVVTEFHTVQGLDMSGRPRMSPDDVVQASLKSLELGEVICAPGVEDAALFDQLEGTQGALVAASVTTQLASRYAP